MSRVVGSGCSLVEIVKRTSALAVLEKASNLSYLFPHRLSEPSSGQPVMERPEDPMSEVKFLDVSNTNTVRHVFNLKPCVEASGNTMLKSHVDVIRPVPSVSGDHRALEATEEFSIFASQHSVWNIGELRNPHHLRVSLGVLGRVQHEIKCLDGTDSSSDCDSFTSDHRCLKIHLAGAIRKRGDGSRCAAVRLSTGATYRPALRAQPLGRRVRPSRARPHPEAGWAARSESNPTPTG